MKILIIYDVNIMERLISMINKELIRVEVTQELNVKGLLRLN